MDFVVVVSAAGCKWLLVAAAGCFCLFATYRKVNTPRSRLSGAVNRYQRFYGVVVLISNPLETPRTHSQSLNIQQPIRSFLFIHSYLCFSMFSVFCTACGNVRHDLTTIQTAPVENPSVVAYLVNFNLLFNSRFDLSFYSLIN